jgi:hypothetical protein
VRTVFFASVLVSFGCSGKVIEASPTDAASADTGETSTVDASEDTVDEGTCTRAADEVGKGVTGAMCTTTVRIAEADSHVIAWNTLCGSFSGTLLDEASARKTLATYPKYTTIDSFMVLTKGSATAPWIFGQSPGDFGGEGAVDARTGIATYYANLSWSALGDVVFPTDALPAPFVCAKTADHKYGIAAIGTAPKTDARAMEALEKTPILRGIERVHAIVGITLLYVPLDGGFGDPGYVPKNEWVALIQSTLLE